MATQFSLYKNDPVKLIVEGFASTTSYNLLLLNSVDVANNPDATVRGVGISIHCPVSIGLKEGPSGVSPQKNLQTRQQRRLNSQIWNSSGILFALPL